MKQDIASRELVIAVGTDHGGLELKNAISAYLAEKGRPAHLLSQLFNSFGHQVIGVNHTLPAILKRCVSHF